MIRNYYKTALRSLLKHKAFTLINISGLAIGISAAMIIYLVVQYDFSFDKFHQDGDRIYRIVSNFNSKDLLGYNSGVPAPLGESVRAQVTGLEQAAPFFIFDHDAHISVPSSASNPLLLKKQNQIILADDAYFKLIRYQWLAGSQKNALAKPYQLVLTAARAQLLFPGINSANIIGKQVIYNDSLKVTVSGIVADLDQNTDFTFQDFISLSSADHNPGIQADYANKNWNNTSDVNQLFIKISKGSSLASVQKQVNAIYQSHSENRAGFKSQMFALQPLSDLHFDANYGNFNQRIANRKVLYSLLGVAAFLLLLGCINFINLTTAQSALRAKEIGVRKTIGGTRKQLISQFLTETFLLTTVATLLSAVMVYYLLKLFSGFIPTGITYSMLFTPGTGLFIILLLAGITSLSGLYPALVMSAYQPVQIIKNQRTVSGKGNTQYLRQGLTVVQFVIAQVFVMATLLVSNQIYYLLHKDLGFDKDAKLYLRTPYSQVNTNHQNVLLNKLKAIPQISLVSLGTDPPSSRGTMSTHMTYKDGKKETESIVYLKFGDENYFKLYGLQLLAGRSPEKRDTLKRIVINETFCKELGFRNPANAVGKMLGSNDTGKPVEIIGVVKDFHQLSLHAPIMPLALGYGDSPYRNMVVHIGLGKQMQGSSNWHEAIMEIEKVWKQVYSQEDFEYTFLDESVASYYTSEQNTGKLLNWATGLSVFISCLGLLGLAIHTTTQRTKEIGIRKVMGATIAQIVSMLSLDFVKLIILAFIIAAPIAWYALNQWLQNFAYHTSISFWLFAGTVVSTVLIALLSMSTQTLKAAMANPVKSLRSE
ncbi:ABC transporter permease [Mucilaginibacter galii]|uniref:ABC transporter permease n=1 Tax=Mucilaginibacter galii TaxID=2005073 RepID=A0A917N1S9_9SPHI|nr:ABC transporter permease [Mucilaginibacter galii]GGI51153.1 ABC transporter permease [Mucilaginibacter galii]